MSDFDDIEATDVEGELHGDPRRTLHDTIQMLGRPSPSACRRARRQRTPSSACCPRQAGVLVVDAEGRLAGIFTERDVLTRAPAADATRARRAWAR